MIWLILSILFSSVLMLIFKLFKIYRVHTFYAIVVNYLICSILAAYFSQKYSMVSFEIAWVKWAILLGFLFISIFFLIAKTTQKMGATVATVAMKLSYVFPIFFAFFIYNEPAGLIKILGIFLSILAVFFTSFKKENKDKRKNYQLFILPFIVFFGSGLADSIVQRVNNEYFVHGGEELFVFVTFTAAFSFGFTYALVEMVKTKTNNFSMKNIKAGILLGVPNYFSIYMLFKALSVSYWEDSFVFPINNIGIVLLSSGLAVLIFKEKLNTYNLIGVALAILSILVMNLKYLL